MGGASGATRGLRLGLRPSTACHPQFRKVGNHCDGKSINLVAKVTETDLAEVQEVGVYSVL